MREKLEPRIDGQVEGVLFHFQAPAVQKRAKLVIFQENLNNTERKEIFLRTYTWRVITATLFGKVYEGSITENVET